MGHSWFIVSLRILARTAWMLQSLLPWSSSFPLSLWATTGLLASWPGEPGCCNPPCPVPQAFKFSCGPQPVHQHPGQDSLDAAILPALVLKLSSLSVGHSWFTSILSKTAWMLQSSLPWSSSFQVFLWATAGSLASWPGQPGCCNPKCKDVRAKCKQTLLLKCQT